MIPGSIQLEPILNKFANLRKGGNGSPGMDNSFSGILAANTAGSGIKNVKPGFNFQFSGIKPEGHELIDWLKKYIQNNVGELDKISADNDALSWFRKLLMDAGFNKNSVDDLINELKGNNRGNGIKLSDLFAKAAVLEENKVEDNDTISLSALPFFQSVLSAMGLANDTIESVLSGAKEEGEGINLSRLIANLRGIDANEVDEKGTHLLDLIAKIKEIGQDGFQNNGSFDGMGDRKTGSMTLEDLISELEDMLAGRTSRNLRGHVLSEDMKRFFSHLNIRDEWTQDTALLKNMNILSAMGRLKGEHNTSDNNNHGSGKRSPFNGQSNGSTGPDLFFDRFSGNPNKAEHLSKNAVFLQTNNNLSSSGIKETFINDLVFRADDTSHGSTESTLSLSNQGVRETGTSSTFYGASLKGSSAKSLPFYMMHQVSKQIFRSIQNGEKEILLQLKPPHLGRLKMSLETVNDVLRVSIITENQNTREILKTHTNDLKTALMEQGIRLEKVDVRIAFNFDQSMAQTKQGSKRSQERRQQVFQLEGNNESMEDGAGLKMPGLALRRDGLLDLVA